MLKSDKKAGRPKKSKPDTIRIQAVLNRQYFREADAVDVAEKLTEDGWTQRKLLTESLIALGEKLESGWEPQEVPSTITIGAQVAEMLAHSKRLLAMLSGMDIEALRKVQGFDEDAYNVANTGASKLISGDTKFDDKEDW
jgi:hypothetical protein